MGRAVQGYAGSSGSLTWHEFEAALEGAPPSQTPSRSGSRPVSASRRPSKLSEDAETALAAAKNAEALAAGNATDSVPDPAAARMSSA